MTAFFRDEYRTVRSLIWVYLYCVWKIRRNVQKQVNRFVIFINKAEKWPLRVYDRVRAWGFPTLDPLFGKGLVVVHIVG